MTVSTGSKAKLFFLREKDQKLGALKGVFIPDILQMIGVILFMRLGWILGNVGLSSMFWIISLASTILLITSFSLSSIVSNMKVGSGGAYFIISRILGIEFGSAIGTLVCISQHASIALCVSGFSLSLQEFLPHIDINIAKAVTLFSLIFISYISTQLAVKAQLLIFVILLVSISSIFWGSNDFVLPSLQPVEGSFANLTFWMGFAMFFPAATGIEAGMSMSGDLKNPSRSLPIGTFASVIVAYLLYSGLAFFLSGKVSSEMLQSHPFIVYHLSKFKILIIVGVWCATLSSALGSILGAPRVLQALAKDRILPSFLGKGHGKSNQPRTAILVVFVISMTLTLGTNINQIIPIMTMICLISYGLINFVAFFESFLKNPSWRPNLNTPWPLALVGGVGCVVVMFLINPIASLIVIALTVTLCIVTSYREIHGSWDDIRHSLFSFLVHKGAAKLSTFTPNAKSWRPNLLTLFEVSSLPQNLAFFSHALDHGKGFLTFATTVLSESDEKEIDFFKNQLSEYKISSFLQVNHSKASNTNLVQQIKNYGFGPLVPNTVILPLSTGTSSQAIYQVLNETTYIKKNIVVFKSDEGNPRLFSEAAVSPKRIDLWWKGGNQNNFELCLALSFSLRGSPIWAGAEIRIKSLIHDERSKVQLTAIFERYKKSLRIKNLTFCPILDENESFFTNLIENSTDSDFTFLGLRSKGIDETDQEYKSYLNILIEKSSPLPNIAYALAGENLSFVKIFT